jgi:hypothetical protein
MASAAEVSSGGRMINVEPTKDSSLQHLDAAVKHMTAEVALRVLFLPDE